MNWRDLQRQAVGLDADNLVSLRGQRLHREAAGAFELLAADARDAGFELAPASAHRSLQRQLAIWNGKLSGAREVLDERDRVIDLAPLGPRQQIEHVLRFSALPGASRHHWGSDVDVFDAAALAPGQAPRLCGAEVCGRGPFVPLHEWLDERIAARASYGFFRPYERDRGGVAPERWHLSHAPSAQAFAEVLSADLLRAAWDEVQARCPLALRDVVEAELEGLLERFVRRIAPAPTPA